MLSVNDKGLLENIISHAKRIEEKIDGVSKKQFDESIDLQEIICFNLFQIGELAKNLSTTFIEMYGGVPWRKIKGLRDRIGHGYGTIEMDRVWATAKNDVKPLREYCEQIIKEN